MPILVGLIAKLHARWRASRLVHRRWQHLSRRQPLSQEQLAALMRDAWSSKRRYRITCSVDADKASETLQRATAVYLGQRRGWLATATRTTAVARPLSFRLQRSA